MPNRRMIFTYIAAVLFFSSAPVFAQAPYEAEPFNGGVTNPIWFVSPSNLAVQWVPDGEGNQALRIEACTSSSAANHCDGSGSSYGQLVANSTSTQIHGGYICGTGTVKPNCVNPDDGNGMQEETWYRFRVRLAPGYLATPGTQNMLVEWHVDAKSEADAKAHGGGTAYSINVNVQAGGSCSGSPAYCTESGSDPRLFLQVPGGATSCGNACLGRFFPFASNSLLINHWYDMVLHVIWSPTAGYVQWWVDGSKMVDASTPTEYVRSDGTWSYAEEFGLYNYRHWANWPSSVDGEEFIWGPSAASINFNPGNPPSVTPSAPSALTGSDSVSASATLSWAASADTAVTGYNVYRTTTSGSGYVTVGTTAALSFTDHTVKTGTTYYYVVTAVANGVQSANSSEIQVTVSQ